MTDDNQIVDVEAEVDAWLAEWGVSPSSEDAESARADAREMVCWAPRQPAARGRWGLRRYALYSLGGCPLGLDI